MNDNEIIVVPVARLEAIVQNAINNALDERAKNDDYLHSRKEICEFLGISARTLSRNMERGFYAGAIYAHGRELISSKSELTRCIAILKN